MPFHWPWSQSTPPIASPPVPPPAPVPVPTIDLESFKVIADVAQKEYANENGRTETLDRKAGTLLGATGAAIAFLSGTLFKPPGAITASSVGPTRLYFGSLILALLLLFFAELCFLLSVRVRQEFERLKLDVWVDFATMQEPGWQTYADLAEDYRKAVAHNTEENNRKARLQGRGVWLLLAGTICLIAVPVAVLWATAPHLLQFG
jgi:hypothetical protein